MLVGGFAASDWLFSKVYESLSPLGLNIVRPENHVWVFFKIKTTLLLKKNFFRNKAVSDGAISFYLDHFVRTRVSKVAYGSFYHAKYDPSDPDHISRSHKVHIDASGAKRIRGSFGIILPKVSCLPLSSKVCFLFVEYPSFGDERIQTILSQAFWFCSPFSSSYWFCLVLPWKRCDSKVERRWYEWEPSHNHPSWANILQIITWIFVL